MIPRIFIVDDEAPARARMVTLLSDIADQCPHQLVGQADHAQQALDGIASLRPDIVLLDVQMPDMTGLELASHLSSEVTGAPAVIFVTAFDEYALKAFDVHALDYLLKPVRAARLAEAIKRVVELQVQTQSHAQSQAQSQAQAQAHSQQGALAAASAALKTTRRHFSVQERGRLLLVPVMDVLYLKAELKYVTLRTRTRDYLIEESLMSIEDELGSTFVRVHRNALVARDAIIGVERATQSAEADGEADKGFESWQVILRDIDHRLPISRRQWSVVKALVR